MTYTLDLHTDYVQNSRSTSHSELDAHAYINVNQVHRFSTQRTSQLHGDAGSGPFARGEPRSSGPGFARQRLAFPPFPPAHLRGLVLPPPVGLPEAFLLVDDSAQGKRYGQFTEVARSQSRAPCTAWSPVPGWST